MGINGKHPPLGRVFTAARASISRVLSCTAIYLGLRSPTSSSGTSALRADTALHSGKDFAVSLPLKGFVTVRTSYARKKHTAGVTCYPSPNLRLVVPGLSS